MSIFKQLIESCLLESTLADYRNHVKSILDNNSNKNIVFYSKNNKLATFTPESLNIRNHITEKNHTAKNFEHAARILTNFANDAEGRTLNIKHLSVEHE